jgi:hypothetical protein
MDEVTQTKVYLASHYSLRIVKPRRLFVWIECRYTNQRLMKLLKKRNQLLIYQNHESML